MIGGLLLVAMIAVSGAFFYYSYSQKDDGGNPGSGFTYTLTHSTTSIHVPKGDVLVVIPLGANENSNLSFKPENLNLELGVNSTILFYDNDTYEHIIQSVQWPSGVLGFQVYVLPHETASLELNATGFYAYNFEIGAPLDDNGTFTVVSG